MTAAFNQAYLSAAGLAPVHVDLRLLAQRMVAQIEQDTSVYKPKRARNQVSTPSRRWRERLRNYEWPYGVGFADASRQVTALFGQPAHCPSSLIRGSNSRRKRDTNCSKPRTECFNGAALQEERARKIRELI
jgi:hypothetical protein